jgi:heme/copper-type cytochrome/quinol oxidase subunit 4
MKPHPKNGEMDLIENEKVKQARNLRRQRICFNISVALPFLLWITYARSTKATFAEILAGDEWAFVLSIFLGSIPLWLLEDRILTRIRIVVGYAVAMFVPLVIFANLLAFMAY